MVVWECWLGNGAQGQNSEKSVRIDRGFSTSALLPFRMAQSFDGGGGGNPVPIVGCLATSLAHLMPAALPTSCP